MLEHDYIVETLERTLEQLDTIMLLGSELQRRQQFQDEKLSRLNSRVEELTVRVEIVEKDC